MRYWILKNSFIRCFLQSQLWSFKNSPKMYSACTIWWWSVILLTIQLPMRCSKHLCFIIYISWLVPAAVAVHILFLFEPFVFSLVLPRGALVFFIEMLFCLELTKHVVTSPFLQKLSSVKALPRERFDCIRKRIEIGLKRISFVYFFIFFW